LTEHTTAVEATNLTFGYGEQLALDGVDLTVHAGERVALQGPSGSGKSTLLHLLAGISAPQAGQVNIFGQRIDSLGADERAAVRLSSMGFVFQFGELLPELSLLENVELPARALGRSAKRSRQRATDLLDSLGIAEVGNRRPAQVSGGQRQRAAMARALVHEPKVVFADEPTGALDQDSAGLALDALLALSTTNNATLVVVTHDDDVARRLDRVVKVRDGLVME